MEIIYSSESPGKDRRWMFNTPCGGFLVAVRYEPLVIAVYHGPRFAITGIQYRSTVISPYNMRPEVEEVFMRKANLLYKDWKWRMNDHYEKTKDHYEKTEEDGKNPYQLPFQDISVDGWKFMIDHIFNDPDWKPRKIAGKKNRNAPVDGYSVASRGHTLGSRSFAAAITIEANKPNGKVPDFCDRYKASHTLKDGGWIDPQYEEIHVRMVAMQDEASQSGCPLTDEELSRSNLGEAKYYVRGFGVGLRPSSFSSQSSSNSAQQELQKVQSEMELLREERRREREEYERRWEEERNRRDEEQRQREEQQRHDDEANAWTRQSVIEVMVGNIRESEEVVELLENGGETPVEASSPRGDDTFSQGEDASQTDKQDTRKKRYTLWTWRLLLSQIDHGMFHEILRHASVHSLPTHIVLHTPRYHMNLHSLHLLLVFPSLTKPVVLYDLSHNPLKHSPFSHNALNQSI